MSDLIERLRGYADNEFNAPGERQTMRAAADEIERLTAAFKLAHEQARSNALEIKVRGNQLAAQKSLWAEAESELEAANKKIAELEAYLFAAELKAKTFEEGYDESQEARRYLEKALAAESSVGS